MKIWFLAAMSMMFRPYCTKPTFPPVLQRKERNEATGPDPSRPPVGMPPKGHKRPCSDVRKAMGAYERLDAGVPMNTVAYRYCLTVPQLQKLLDKHGKAARREIRREGQV